MPVNTPENVSCRQYGDWLKVDWSYLPLESGDTLAGFKVKYGDGSLPSGWATPPAVDTVLQGGDGGSPREYYSLLLRISDGLICDWESFETYPVGPVGVMADGGSMWDGPAVVGDNYLGIIARENFESYTVGAVPADTGDLSGGVGWDGPAVVGGFS